MPTYSQPRPSDHGFRPLRLEETDSLRRPQHARHERGCHCDNIEGPRLAGTIKGPLVLLKGQRSDGQTSFMSCQMSSSS